MTQMSLSTDVQSLVGKGITVVSELSAQAWGACRQGIKIKPGNHRVFCRSW